MIRRSSLSRLIVLSLWVGLGLVSLADETRPAAAGPREVEGAPTVAAAGDEITQPGLYAVFHTAQGVIVAELFYEKAPITVGSFVGLAEGTLPAAGSPRYFDGLTFHRVVPGFVVQGGDPLGTGEGGPGYSFPDEFVPGLRHDDVGVLSMANSGQDTNGSQFFFTLVPVNRLNYLHSVFGRVVKGREVLSRIQKGDTFRVTLVRRGEAAENFQVTPERFKAWLAQAKRAIPPHFADPEGLLPSDPPRERAFNAKLQNFERFTGEKLYVRLYPAPDPAERAKSPDEIARRLAEELRVGEAGVLGVYFADTASWGLWRGGQRMTLWAPTNDGSTDVSELRQKDFFAQARTAAEQAVAKVEAEGRTLTPAEKLKLEVDEVLDGLIDRLERLMVE